MAEVIGNLIVYDTEYTLTWLADGFICDMALLRIFLLVCTEARDAPSSWKIIFMNF